ncbi:TPA: methionine--tRNA ligase [Candidatus Uhrbacteria bacterium]|nr:methionine--tRNA ligase [Candidatus Uhrbacteria bacterium]
MKNNDKPKFYITTPIYYVNAKPHIGHAYTTIACDVLARYNRLLGKDVFFLTGTDENSQKNVQAAEKEGVELQMYLNQMSAVWQETFDSLGFTNNYFIRTTEERHKKAVEKFFNAVYERGDIYKGEYEGLYCEGCEAFVGRGDLVGGECPIHKTKPKSIKEQNFFFSLSKYREPLLSFIKESKDFIQPKSRRNEIISYIEKFMTDISISRESAVAGIPVPVDQSQKIYVWFDALINYLSGIGYGWDDEMFKKYWPADVHVVGKDIIKFHCALWPAMLMSAGLALPKRVFAHGFFTINGEKMSKSLGNVVSPAEIVEKFGVDAARYLLLALGDNFGEDMDFTWARMIEKYNADLANGLGNLVSRVVKLSEKSGKFVSQEFFQKDEISGMVDRMELSKALKYIWGLVSESNKIIDESKPWELVKNDKMKFEEVMNDLTARLQKIAENLMPFMPETAEKIMVSLETKKTDILFGRIAVNLK